MIRVTIWRFALALTSAVLAACGSTPEPETPLPVRYDYALSADITPQSNREEVEARYGGRALIWHPEAGFAVLGVQGSLTPASTEAHLESNRDAFSIPSVNAQGRSSWASGRSSWASGRSSWASGTGEGATTPKENLGAWQQINLAQGQAGAASSGRGVKVAVIDSGVDVYHPALQGGLAPEGEWRDFIDGDALPLDEKERDSSNAGHGHGTGVAGIILQIAPEATILPLRVLGPDGSGDLTDVAMAIDWAAQRGADIINLSLGADGDTDSDAVSRVLTYARQKHGVLIVASSGNTGDDKVTFPARLAQRSGHDALVSVGSVDTANVRSDFSTYGPKVSLYAPGEAVHTLAPERSLTNATGTSFAAPIVAGTLALALGDAEEDAEEEGGGAASYARALLASVNKAMDSRDDTDAGMLDVGRFLGFVENAAPSDITLSRSSVLENQDPGTLVGSFSAPDGGTWRYRLVAGEADNGSFTVVGDELRNAERFDFEARSEYSVLVEVAGADGVFQQRFAVNVEDVDEERPVVAFDNPGALTAGQTVTLTGTATDNVKLNALELYEDVTHLGEATLDPSSGTWSYLYAPRSAGTFTLRAVASDAAGNVLETTVTVTVAEPELWPVQFGNDATNDDAESITVDAEGNLYIVGKTQAVNTPANNRDAFVMKLNSHGDQVWTEQIVSDSTDEAEGVATDTAGNLYVVGYTQGDLEGNNAGGADAFVAQYDSHSGEQTWIDQFGGAGRDEAEAVVVDAAGNIYIAGHTTSGSTNFDKEIFVAKYKSDGVQEWFKQFGSAANEESNSIAVDAAGNIYIAGYTGGDLAGLGSNVGGFDIFIAKYRSNGDQEWLEQFGSEVDDEGKGVVVDAAGNAYVIGYTRGSLAYANAGNSDFVIAKYDGSGNQMWLEQFGSASGEGAHAAAIDAQGYVIVTGYTYGDTAGTYAGSGDILTIAYDSAGTQVWAEQRGSAQRDEADAVAVDAQGNIFITGYTNSTLDGAPIEGNNIFVMKLRSSAAAQ